MTFTQRTLKAAKKVQILKLIRTFLNLSITLFISSFLQNKILHQRLVVIKSKEFIVWGLSKDRNEGLRGSDLLLMASHTKKLHKAYVGRITHWQFYDLAM